MKILIDMNLSPRWAELFASAGIEAIHWSALGQVDAPDIEIMAYAQANDYVVLTHDLDFSAILAATGGEKPSVIQIRSDDVSPDVIGKQVITAFDRVAIDLANGALLTVEPGNFRLRILPLIRQT